MRIFTSFGSLLAVAAFATAPVLAAGEDFFADPTRPPDFSAGAGGAAVDTGPMLQSTRVSPAQTTATIDGKTYRVGDRFAGSEIVEIRPFEVVLRAPGRNGAAREWRLRMVPKLTKAAGVEPAADGTKTDKAERRATEDSK